MTVKARDTVIQAARREGKTVAMDDAVITSVRLWLQYAEPGDRMGIVINGDGTPMKLTEGPRKV